MYSTKQIQKSLLERFSDQERLEQTSHSIAWEEHGGNSRHLNQFFKTAEHRKRQILEKMLMD